MGYYTETRIIEETKEYRLLNLWDNDWGLSGTRVCKLQSYWKGIWGLFKGWYTMDKWVVINEHDLGGKGKYYLEKYFSKEVA